MDKKFYKVDSSVNDEYDSSTFTDISDAIKNYKLILNYNRAEANFTANIGVYESLLTKKEEYLYDICSAHFYAYEVPHFHIGNVEDEIKEDIKKFHDSLFNYYVGSVGEHYKYLREAYKSRYKKEL